MYLQFALQRYYDLVTTPLHRCYNPVTSHSVTSFSHICNIFVTACQYLCSAIRDRTIPLVAPIMTKEKAERITRIYNWVRFIILLLFLTFVFAGLANAQTSADERLSLIEKCLEKSEQNNQFLPQIHGILRGKFEYQPEMGAGRFEVRNARLSASGKLPLRSEYKLEVDLCDESAIKMKDAWVRVNPVGSLRITFGQQRMPFSIDAHRNPSAQYFANRSFIAKQVGDMRDVGAAAGYDVMQDDRKVVSLDAGVYNGSNLDNQKTAWFTAPAYSARIQYFPIKAVAIIPSVQHQLIAERKASYTSFDIGAYYESPLPSSPKRGGVLHIEAEYLRKHYADNAFDDCSAIDAMVIYKHNLNSESSFIESISYLGRYDWMQDHSDGKKGFADDATRLQLTDAERHRMTLGATFSVRNPYFPTDIRLNYEKYWYPHGGAKESEQDKFVAELMIRF